MRDVVVFLLFVGVLPLCFLRPWVGLCTFTWLAYNRTQDLTWGFARTLPISQLVAIFMILGWMVIEPRPLRLRSPMVKAMVLLLVWVGVSMLGSGLDWELQGNRYTELGKVMLISLITGALITSRDRLRVLVAIIAVGLGFYGSKNGLMYLAGSETIVGPGGMLKDNNDFSLAMVMNMPFLWYLADDVGGLRWGRPLRLFMRATFWLGFLTIMSTGSRGGFLALGVALTVMALKTRFKIPALVLMGVGGVTMLVAAPAEYRERISSIFAGSEEMDGSVKGRLVSWQVAGNMIEAHPITGIGFNQMVKKYNNYTEGVVNEQGTTEHYARVAHNTYLQIWAESGTPAYLLFMFMLLGSIAWLEVAWRRFRRQGDTWVVPYCHAIQVAFIAFLVGATFLNRAHFDLTYQLVVLASVLPHVVAAERLRAAERRRGPGPADVVTVEAGDPFVWLGSR